MCCSFQLLLSFSLSIFIVQSLLNLDIIIIFINIIPVYHANTSWLLKKRIWWWWWWWCHSWLRNNLKKSFFFLFNGKIEIISRWGVWKIIVFLLNTKKVKEKHHNMISIKRTKKILSNFSMENSIWIVWRQFSFSNRKKNLEKQTINEIHLHN